MYGELSWDIAPQTTWIVGSTSRNPGYDTEVSSSRGVVFNTKVVRWGINARKQREADNEPG